MGKVLVVDDEVKLREALSRLLEEDGHEVVQANDGGEALERIDDSHPDVVLLDVLMPKLDGFGVLRALRQNELTRDLPVVMVTVRGRPADRDAAGKLGVVDYIVKPWMEGELELRVQWALKGAGRVPAVPWDLSAATADYSNTSLLADKRDRLATRAAGGGVEVVTPEDGGTVKTEDGTVRVDVPAGAVRNPMALDAAPAAGDEPPDQASLRIKMGTKTADLTFIDRTGMPIEGVRLDKPARISITYSGEDVEEAGSVDDLAIQKYNHQSGEWVGLPTSIDLEGKTTSTRERRFPAPVLKDGEHGKVLIVEDEESVRLPLVDAMEDSGYDVIEESDGARVSKRIMEERPDVVLLDISLPRLDGFQVLRQIKGDPATRSTTVIMMSSQADPNELAASLTLGARDYVTKPSHIGDLQHRVRRAVTASRARMHQAERAVARARRRIKKRLVKS